MNRGIVFLVTVISAVTWPAQSLDDTILLSGLLLQGADSQICDDLHNPTWTTFGNETAFSKIYLTKANAGYLAPFINEIGAAEANYCPADQITSHFDLILRINKTIGKGELYESQNC